MLILVVFFTRHEQTNLHSPAAFPSRSLLDSKIRGCPETERVRSSSNFEQLPRDKSGGVNAVAKW